MPFFLTPWFWEFFFANPQQPHFYEAAVWGNVAAVLPLGILGYLYLRSRHEAVLAAHRELKAAHVEHAEKLDRLLDKMDPTTDGGLAELHTALADVQDRLDTATPGGLQEIAERLDALAKPRPARKVAVVKVKEKKP